MSDNLTVERVDLQKKDKSELQTIVIALGGKPASRATKADLIAFVFVFLQALQDDAVNRLRDLRIDPPGR